MPIKKQNQKRYPPKKAWARIRNRILARSRGRCECTGECGLHPNRRCQELHYDSALFAGGRVILTLAHLDHQPENNSDDNLKAMCQRCHNRYDRQHRYETRIGATDHPELPGIKK